MREKYDARTKAEEMYKEQIWALRDKLKEEHDGYELLQEQCEILQDELEKRRNRCNLGMADAEQSFQSFARSRSADVSKH